MNKTKFKFFFKYFIKMTQTQPIIKIKSYMFDDYERRKQRLIHQIFTRCAMRRPCWKNTGCGLYPVPPTDTR